MVSPWPGRAFEHEKLSITEPPSSWYLTGYLVPAGTQPQAEAVEDDELTEAAEVGQTDGEDDDERPSMRRVVAQSSMGLSFLVDAEMSALTATVSWGDYVRVDPAKPRAP